MDRADSCSKSRYLQALLASTALVSSGGAHAQSGGSEAGPRSGPMEEIVVRGVARKLRPDDQNSATGLDMSLLDTPQGVTILTTEMLELTNANSVYDATDLVPNMQKNGFGFGLEKIFMRGIENRTHRVNGLLMDHRQTSLDAVSMDRIEVVRGPATALYGVTGSFGGEMNNILKRPLNRPRMEVSAQAGSYDSSAFTFDITGPIAFAGDGFSARLVGKYREYGLPLDIPGEDFPNYESVLFGSASWDIGDRSKLVFSWHHQERNMDPWDGGAVIENPDGSLSLPDVDPEEWYFSHPDQSDETLDIEFGLLEFEHEFRNGWRSTSQISYNRWDEDLSYFFPFGPFGGYSLGDDEIYIYTYDVERDGDTLTFKQSLGGEFELFDRGHQFFVAAEYMDNGGNEEPRFELLNSSFRGFGTIDMYARGVYDGTPRLSDGSPLLPTDPDREALFGVRQEAFETNENLRLSAQLLLNLNDRVSVITGAMYEDTENVNTIPITRSTVQDPPIVTETAFDEIVFRFGVTYDFVDSWGFVNDGRLYYNYSEGFEPQTITDGDGVTRSAPQEMDQHEIGLKVELWESAVGVELIAFDYEITNIIVSSFFLGSFGGFGSTVLEGRQEATGVELSVTGEVLPGWNVAWNLGFIDAEILNPNNTFGIPPRTTPEVSSSITTTYEFIHGRLAGLRIGLTAKYSDDYSFIEGTSNVDRFAYLEDGGHERVDLHASYQPHSGPLRNAEVFFKWHNIFDEDVIVAKQGNPGFGVMFIDQQRMSAGIRYTLE